jgi:cytochrome c peroxidase
MLLCAAGVVVLAGCATGEQAMPGEKTAMEKTKRLMMMPEAQRIQHIVAVKQASLERAKALFEDTRLGTSGMTCSTCHVDGGGTSGVPR